MISPTEALAKLHIDWADTPDNVWQESRYHVEGLHAAATAQVERGIRAAADSTGSSPIGLVLQGLKGIGKTHLHGTIRGRAHSAGGYFFLSTATDGGSFWDDTAVGIRSGLLRPHGTGGTQLGEFVLRLCQRLGVDPDIRAAVVDGRALRRGKLDALVAALRAVDRQVATECGDALRAMVLYGQGYSHIGESYLGGDDEFEPDERQAWGIRTRNHYASRRVQDVTRLLALTGPVVVGVDQLDGLLVRREFVAPVADGLMELRERTRRTLTVLTCLPDTWDLIKGRSIDTVADRFREAQILSRVLDPEVGRELVRRRLGVAYADMGFTPPHPTWPVPAEVFEQARWDAPSPRDVLRLVYRHIDEALRADTPPDRFAQLDEAFEGLRASADPDRLLQPASEDDLMPEVLAAALRSWIQEVGNDDLEWAYRDWHGANDELHAMLIRTLDEHADVEEHWGFRTISVDHPIAVLSRFRKANSAIGFGSGNRHLIVLRNREWSKGGKTVAELNRFDSAGGRRLSIAEKDLRTFWALRELQRQNPPGLHDWVVERRPASGTTLLSKVLPKGRADSEPPPAEGGVLLGVEDGTGEQIRLDPAALRQHAVVFAGSGSGKTVLLRRIVEECALLGVSSIVLDPNNDLARLGDPWPRPPSGWAPGDAAAARRYLDETDVVVWTPGRVAGRPLAFRPLPDFAEALDDEDEFTAAVEVAVATVAPQVRVTGTTRKAVIGQAVLRQAITHYARSGARGLPGLVQLLSDLPDGVSTLAGAGRIAAELAESLKAAAVNDPLFAGGGEPVDPGELLTPAAGKRARVSVISFVGLPAEEQRQSFVSRLQMELFAWAKRNPAGDRPLGALLVMDEAQTLAASGSLSPSARSTIVLASQARKYGLGLLFATQAPKGLHNQVVGNAMTQFFGRLNSPAQIAAATELARAKGSQVADISSLGRARFYVSGEAFGFRRVTTPLCLSHHPAAPLRLEDVLERARR
ncbi:helicase HerA domain-containing protein [Actinokineospora sp. G85]|uniref:helicase HerA domain-containing protein n=1 Tax=Actinokineospora sp. G85 TaxID=3406626 RepID=UPI003C78804B